MNRCQRCQTELPPADGTEEADWRTLCDDCEYPEDSDDPGFDCDHEEFDEDILTGRRRCAYCRHEWSAP